MIRSEKVYICDKCESVQKDHVKLFNIDVNEMYSGISKTTQRYIQPFSLLSYDGIKVSTRSYHLCESCYAEFKDYMKLGSE